MEKRLIIIGAGLAGLSAGCYGRMNGYRTSIFEMHDKSGGVCTGWKRNDYTIDGCLHWLVGTSPANKFYHIWKELGVLKGQTVVDHEQFMCIEGQGGKTFIVYCDIDRLEHHMKELAPEDADTIEEFIEGIRACTRLDMPVEKAPELYTPFDALKMVFGAWRFWGILIKWGKVSTQDFARRFKDPFLSQAFSQAFAGDLDRFPLLFMLMTLAWLHQKTAGYIVGGALELARSIERRYLDLGGELHHRSRVARIIVEADKAVGIQLSDGSEHRGDIIISAADGHSTIFAMLAGKYMDAKVRSYYDRPQLFPPLVYVGLGVARSFADLTSGVAGMAFPLREPIKIGGREYKRLGVQIYNFDPTLAPPGRTVLKVQFNTDYDYWKELRKEPELYKAEKGRIADHVIAALDQRFPGLAGQVEVSDVATPVTWERYTGNWRGSYEGWLMSKDSIMTRMSKTLPGLGNFYMAGQWVQPGGGLPTVVMSGRNVIQIICKRDRKRFVTTMP